MSDIDLHKEELDHLRLKIRSCFYRWTMKDPYPEITLVESIPRSFIKKMGLKTKEPPKVSAHQAWRDGYEFAKALVMKELDP